MPDEKHKLEQIKIRPKIRGTKVEKSEPKESNPHALTNSNPERYAWHALYNFNGDALHNAKIVNVLCYAVAAIMQNASASLIITCATATASGHSLPSKYWKWMSKLTQTTIEAGASAVPVIRTMQGSRPCHREHSKRNSAQAFRLFTEIGSVSAKFESLTQTA